MSRRGAAERSVHQTVAEEKAAELIRRLIDDDAALVDDDDAVADELDVRACRARVSTHRLALRARMLADEIADRGLGGDVEADGRFVEKEQRRTVQQARHDLAAHALTERKTLHRLSRRSPRPKRSTRLAWRRRKVSRSTS